MSKISDLIRYVCGNYPNSSDLSNARLTKIIYLADWENTRTHGCQMTDINWYFNNYGPFVDDVRIEAVKDPALEVVNTETIYGTPKVQIRLIGDVDKTRLESSEMKILDNVIATTKNMYWNSFINYVYSTYPVRRSPRYSTLDLVALSKLEKEEISNI